MRSSLYNYIIMFVIGAVSRACNFKSEIKGQKSYISTHMHFGLALYPGPQSLFNLYLWWAKVQKDRACERLFWHEGIHFGPNPGLQCMPSDQVSLLCSLNNLVLLYLGVKLISGEVSRA